MKYDPALKFGAVCEQQLPSRNQKGCSIPHKTADTQRLAEDKTKHQIKNLSSLEYFLHV